MRLTLLICAMTMVSSAALAQGPIGVPRGAPTQRNLRPHIRRIQRLPRALDISQRYRQTKMGFMPVAASRIILPGAPARFDGQAPIGFDYPGRRTWLSGRLIIKPEINPQVRIGFLRAAQGIQIVPLSAAQSPIVTVTGEPAREQLSPLVAPIVTRRIGFRRLDETD